MINMFVSYCQKDSVYADNIDLYFKGKDISIHRDIREISNWKSIRDYMEKIRDMDYAILIISDNYLKSFNCMYEVLEVMKEKNYENKIFPVVVESSIYPTAGRIPYIKYWQDKFKELQSQVAQIDFVNAGNLIEDLKRTQHIVLSMDDFLAKVSDMNNPNISNVNQAIESKLKEYGLVGDIKEDISNRKNENEDVFSSLNIPRVSKNYEPTDLEKNKFMTTSFNDINNLLVELCNQAKKDDSNLQIDIEQVDTRNVIYQYYKYGKQVRGMKLFLGNSLGGRENNIGISCDNYFFGNNGSYNGMISSKVENGELGLYFLMSMSYKEKCMSVKEVVKEIWIYYVQPYLS